jgi:N6-L-threonylcarbamoyladenine synthase
MVLGIESSCDETAAALVDETGRVYADVVASQIELHSPFGGVVPELASRAHLQNVIPVISEALDVVDGDLSKIDAIAVTQGPGLVGALLVGVQVAKALAWVHKLPLVGVNHLDGHLLAPFLRRGDDPESDLGFPYIGLLASGGHTALYEVVAADEITLLGQTRDDAAGEAFDKAAKVMGLGYPGGPKIDRLAARGNALAVPFTPPMLHRGGLDFSFSGLKTAVAQHVRKHGVPESESDLADLSASFQRAVVEVLAKKAIKACKAREISTLVLAGGVAANRGLRARAGELAAKEGISLHVPALASCTDNAAMIAYTGALALARGERAGIDMAAYSRDPERVRGRFDRDGKQVPRRPPGAADG